MGERIQTLLAARCDGRGDEAALARGAERVREVYAQILQNGADPDSALDAALDSVAADVRAAADHGEA